jgi:hypothetical protein
MQVVNQHDETSKKNGEASYQPAPVRTLTLTDCVLNWSIADDNLRMYGKTYDQ